MKAVPFSLLVLPSTPEDQNKCARQYVHDKVLSVSKPLWRGETYAHDRIRVAYVSADLGDHVVAQVAAGVFEAHDRTRFEATALNLGSAAESDTRNRLLGAFDRFLDVQAKDDLAIASLIRELEIDIVVDPSGFTRGFRAGIFARRPAPVQVNWLGYSSTMGASYIDYIIADETVIPPDQQAYYSEKVVYLPGTFFPTDNKRSLPEPISRAIAGLPENGFVFCCFNQSYKILPGMFDSWMRLLHKINESILWLSAMGDEAESNLRREARARGIAEERIIFAPRLPKTADHLARLRLADLFLDTRPYNAHATANDALWAGVTGIDPALARLSRMRSGEPAEGHRSA